MASKKDKPVGLSAPARREVLRRLGRYAAVSAPAVTLLMAAETKPAAAVTSILPCAAINQNG